MVAAGHPVPDQGSLDSARRGHSNWPNPATADDLVLVLLSGGGSAN